MDGSKGKDPILTEKRGYMLLSKDSKHKTGGIQILER